MLLLTNTLRSLGGVADMKSRLAQLYLSSACSAGPVNPTAFPSIPLRLLYGWRSKRRDVPPPLLEPRSTQQNPVILSPLGEETISHGLSSLSRSLPRFPSYFPPLPSRHFLSYVCQQQHRNCLFRGQNTLASAGPWMDEYA